MLLWKELAEESVRVLHALLNFFFLINTHFSFAYVILPYPLCYLVYESYPNFESWLSALLYLYSLIFKVSDESILAETGLWSVHILMVIIREAGHCASPIWHTRGIAPKTKCLYAERSKAGKYLPHLLLCWFSQKYMLFPRASKKTHWFSRFNATSQLLGAEFISSIKKITSQLL